LTETPPLGRMKRRTSSTEGTSEQDPVSILKGGKGSRDNSKDRRTVSESEEVLPGKPLSRTGSIKKSSSFNKNKSFTDKKKISFDEDVDVEPISQAKQLFAAIADTTLESGRQKLRDNSRDRVNEAFSRTEPAEWDPEENPDNEDELMIILDTPEVSRADDAPLKSRSQSGDRSTGFSHLDEFEKRLAEMQDEMEVEESKTEPIYAKILPKKDRQAADTERLTDDGYYINKDQGLPYYEPDEDVGSEYSRKKVSFAQSEERFEFDVPKKDTAFRSFTKFLAKELPLNFRRDPSLDAKLQAAEGASEQIEDLNKENEPPLVPRRSRSRSKNRSVSLQRPIPQHPQQMNIIGARSQSLSRTGDDNSAKSFLSAMTGGLYDSNSGIGGRGVRPGSRQSSGDRSSLMSWSGMEEDPSLQSCSEVDNSVLGQLKKIKMRKPKQVQQADFDELFARGMAMSAKSEELDGGDVEKKVERKKKPLAIPTVEIEDKSSFSLNETMKKDNGIGYAEKVMSYLDDQAKTEMLEEDGGHMSRGRKKHKTKTSSRPASESSAATKQKEERKRSREYTKPEDIKLSPVIKRDLFTGEIITDSQSLTLFNKSLVTSARPALAITSSPQVTDNALSTRINAIQQQSKHTQGMAPSPGKSFLEATTGQEVFGTSIEEDNPMLKQPPVIIEPIANGHTPMNSAYDAYDTAISARKTLPMTSNKTVTEKEKREEPADKGIPVQLKPDKLLANEEFYEQLRDSMREVKATQDFEATQEDPESYSKYSHHLGRAEFGTLKKRTSTRPSAATSRDPSGDRIGQRSLAISRDTSGDRLAVASKQPFGSKDIIGRSESRMSGASGGLPDLEVDENIAVINERDLSGDRVQRTASLLMGGVDMDRPGDFQADLDILAKKEGVLRDIEDKKNQIKEAKAWIQNGLMTVVGVGVMAYLQTLESMGS